MWKCPKCRENVESSFDVCWNCGTARDGTEDTSFRRAEDVERVALDLPPLRPEPRREPQPQKPLSLVCPRCGSHEVIPHVRIVDRGDGNWRRDLQVEVYESPDALLFKGTHEGTLRAAICGLCGHADLYVTNPAELLAAYRRSRER